MTGIDDPYAAVSGRLPAADMLDVLLASGFTPNDAHCVNSNLESGPYAYYTVIREQRDVGMLEPRTAELIRPNIAQNSIIVLSINTFRLDSYVDSKTGEAGQLPHGMLLEYIPDMDGNWISFACCNYGG